MSRLEAWIWDQLVVEQARIEAATARPAQPSGLLRRRRLRGRWGARRLAVALVVIAVPGAAGGLALAGALEGKRINPQQWVEGKRVVPERAITAEQAAHLAVLRRPRTAADALPPMEAYAATHSPMAADGVNPSLSRRALGFAQGGAWLIPGNGVVCLTTANASGLRQQLEAMPTGSRAPHAATHRRGALGNTACATNAQANEGASAGTSGSADAPGIVSTAGIVPDGVGSVTVALTGGGTVTLPVHENVYTGDVRGWPASVSFVGPQGRVTLENGPPPHAVPLRRPARSAGPMPARALHVPVHLHLQIHGSRIIGAQLSFRAPYAVVPGHGGYEVDGYCGVDVTSTTIARAIARGSIVAASVFPWSATMGRCATTYEVKVLYRSDALSGGRVASMSGSSVLVGSLTERKPAGARPAYR